MRAYLPAYDLRAPDTLSELLSMLAAAPGAWRPFAGGTDLMVQLESGALPEGQYLALWKIGELRGIRETSAGVVYARHTRGTGASNSRTIWICVSVGVLKTAVPLVAIV